MNAYETGAYRWFRAHGIPAASSLSMARAEDELSWAQHFDRVVVRWESDDFADEPNAEGCSLVRVCDACVAEGRTGADRCKHARVMASLWGIVDATPAYRREIEAELALEALDELREIVRVGHW